MREKAGRKRTHPVQSGRRSETAERPRRLLGQACLRSRTHRSRRSGADTGHQSRQPRRRRSNVHGDDSRTRRCGSSNAARCGSLRPDIAGCRSGVAVLWLCAASTSCPASPHGGTWRDGPRVPGCPKWRPPLLRRGLATALSDSYGPQPTCCQCRESGSGSRRTRSWTRGQPGIPSASPARLWRSGSGHPE